MTFALQMNREKTYKKEHLFDHTRKQLSEKCKVSGEFQT